ncbi:hypothetical protein D9M70_617470 [compost metagenome]
MQIIDHLRLGILNIILELTQDSQGSNSRRHVEIVGRPTFRIIAVFLTGLTLGYIHVNRNGFLQCLHILFNLLVYKRLIFELFGIKNSNNLVFISG